MTVPDDMTNIAHNLKTACLKAANNFFFIRYAQSMGRV
jgi:hypothetical protein